MDTREKLVRTAERLMLRDGYSATRVDDVIRKAGLSKGSFYHFFDSKEALGLAALEHYYADRVGRLAAGTYATETDPLRRAHGFLKHASHVAADLWSDGMPAGQPCSRRRWIKSSHFERTQEANQ